MKAVKPEPYPMDESIIVVRKKDEWELMYWSRFLGHSRIGPRLARKDPLPSVPTTAATRMEAMDFADQWQQWLDKRPKRKTKKR